MRREPNLQDEWTLISEKALPTDPILLCLPSRLFMSDRMPGAASHVACAHICHTLYVYLDEWRPRARPTSRFERSDTPFAFIARAPSDFEGRRRCHGRPAHLSSPLLHFLFLLVIFEGAFLPFHAPPETVWFWCDGRSVDRGQSVGSVGSLQITPPAKVAEMNE